jgi:hypothetical protein
MTTTSAKAMPSAHLRCVKTWLAATVHSGAQTCTFVACGLYLSVFPTYCTHVVASVLTRGALGHLQNLVAAKGMAEDRFARVRSTVRENIGWSLCMVTTHELPVSTRSKDLALLVGGLVQSISNDQNIISVGFAMDALHRLSRHGYAEAVQACAAVMDPKAALCPAESLCRTQDGAGPLPSCQLG